MLSNLFFTITVNHQSYFIFFISQKSSQLYLNILYFLALNTFPLPPPVRLLSSSDSSLDCRNSLMIFHLNNTSLEAAYPPILCTLSLVFQIYQMLHHTLLFQPKQTLSFFICKIHIEPLNSNYFFRSSLSSCSSIRSSITSLISLN